MGFAERIGAWTLHRPVGVLSGLSALAGGVLGFNAGGLTGACVGAVSALAMTALLWALEPRDPTFGPHH